MVCSSAWVRLWQLFSWSYCHSCGLCFLPAGLQLHDSRGCHSHTWSSVLAVTVLSSLHAFPIFRPAPVSAHGALPVAPCISQCLLDSDLEECSVWLHAGDPKNPLKGLESTAVSHTSPYLGYAPSRPKGQWWNLESLCQQDEGSVPKAERSALKARMCCAWWRWGLKLSQRKTAAKVPSKKYPWKAACSGKSIPSPSSPSGLLLCHSFYNPQVDLLCPDHADTSAGGSHANWPLVNPLHPSYTSTICFLAGNFSIRDSRK